MRSQPVTGTVTDGPGVLYSLGALAYAFKRPNPWPRVFGYHEVFHAFVIAAAACHFVSTVLALPAMRAT